jgi:hypothetical protein
MEPRNPAYAWIHVVLVAATSCGACSGQEANELPDARITSRREAGPPRTVLDASARPSVPPVMHTYAPTYDAIWREILLPNCAGEFCHGGSGLFLDLESKADGYKTLVGFPAAGAECKESGLLHVRPGQPEKSLFYLKVTDPPCGQRMPLLYGTTTGRLDAREVEQIRIWIERGAPDDGVADAAVVTESGASP